MSSVVCDALLGRCFFGFFVCLHGACASSDGNCPHGATEPVYLCSSRPFFHLFPDDLTAGWPPRCSLLLLWVQRLFGSLSTSALFNSCNTAAYPAGVQLEGRMGSLRFAALVAELLALSHG